MAKGRDRLSVKTVQALKVAGLHADGGGLYLRVDASGAKRWAFIFQWDRKRAEMSLGSARDVTLAQARDFRDAARAHLLAGRNPIEARKQPVSDETAGGPLFGAFADAYLEDRRGEWTGAKTYPRWKLALETHCAPIRSTPIDQVATEHLEAVLRPIWTKIPEMAPRVRSAIEEVLDAARVKGLRSGENPARWKGHLEHLLASPKKLSRGHHPAMPYTIMPAFLARLREGKSLSHRLIEFTILTVSRPSEARMAPRTEINHRARIWTVPEERMKERRAHRVPLSDAAMSVLERLPNDTPWLFPGLKEGRPLSNNAGAKLLDLMGFPQYTVHGFRSSFRDWVGEETDFPREIAEAALAHLSGDETERAYRRGDALEKRRRLMEAWAAYLGYPYFTAPLTPSRGL